jgi:hypothetical protein
VYSVYLYKYLLTQSISKQNAINAAKSYAQIWFDSAYLNRYGPYEITVQDQDGDIIWRERMEA